MEEKQKAAAAIERAEHVGLALRYDRGFLMLTSNGSRPQAAGDDAIADRIAELGESIAGVFERTLARARDDRGSQFVGRKVFIWDRQVFGRVKHPAGSGLLTVVFDLDKGDDRISHVGATHTANQMLVMLDDVAATDSPAIPPARVSNDRIRPLLEECRREGFAIAHDSGFLTLVRIPSTDSSANGAAQLDVAVLGGLGRFVGDLDLLAMNQERAMRDREFAGRQVFLPSVPAFGRIQSVGMDGFIDAEYDDEILGRALCRFPADYVIVIDSAFYADGSGDEKSGETSDGFFGRIRRAISLGLSRRQGGAA